MSYDDMLTQGYAEWSWGNWALAFLEELLHHEDSTGVFGSVPAPSSPPIGQYGGKRPRSARQFCWRCGTYFIAKAHPTTEIIGPRIVESGSRKRSPRLQT
jgi:hypothetical protein